MNKRIKTTIIFTLIIAIVIAIPLILKYSYSGITYEHVEEITIDENSTGKTYLGGTKIVQNETVIIHYLIYKLRLADQVVSSGGGVDYYGQPIPVPDSFLSSVSKYWKVDTVERREGILHANLVAVFEKGRFSANQRIGAVLTSYTPIDITGTDNVETKVYYYDKNHNLIGTQDWYNAEYGSTSDAYIAGIDNLSDVSYYWRIIGLENSEGESFIEASGKKYIDYIYVQATDDPTEWRKINLNNEDANKGTAEIIEYTDLNHVPSGSTIRFRITPEPGYDVKDITIKDWNNTSIAYTKLDSSSTSAQGMSSKNKNKINDAQYAAKTTTATKMNNTNSNASEYEFIMPVRDVTINVTYRKAKYSVNVEVKNETKDIDIKLDDFTQVEYNDEVKFTITPITGYQLNSVTIIDSKNNEIPYTNEGDEYTFTMPDSDVTIIPVYEKVSNSVDIDDSSNDKEIIIEVNDVSAVVYEEKVRFKVVPPNGYTLEEIEVTDENSNRIEVTPTENENEYEFVMPAVSVKIKPKFKSIEPAIPNTNSTQTPTIYILFVEITSIILLLVMLYLIKRDTLKANKI